MAFCSSCGKEMPADSQFCPSCGTKAQSGTATFSAGPAPAGRPQSVQPQMRAQQMGAQRPMAQIPNHMTKAIIATILSVLCCTGITLIPGVIAIVFASQVDGKARMGDIRGAEQSAKNASIFANITIGLNILMAIGFIIMFIIGMVSEASGY